MKIALLRQRAGGPGGAETTLQHLARGLAAAGHRVTVYGAGQAESGVLGPEIAYQPVPVWGGKTGRLLSYVLNARRLLRRTAPQLVFSLERTLFQQVYRAGDGCHKEWLARRAPYLTRSARAALSLSLFHRVMLALEKRLFADSNLQRVIANSRQVQGEILRHYGFDEARIRLIYNGLDHDQFHPLPDDGREALRASLGAPDRAPLVLFVGSGFGRKGLAYLISAFARLQDPAAVLWVVGKGNPAPYRRLAERLGCASRLKFWGAQSDVAPFYQAADLLALPTLYDPCSNVVLEAMGCGAPVITTAANGAAEFITAEENGVVLAAPDDVEGLSQALAAWLEQGRDSRIRSRAARAVAHLDWGRTLAQTLEVLEETAAAGPL